MHRRRLYRRRRYGRRLYRRERLNRGRRRKWTNRGRWRKWTNRWRWKGLNRWRWIQRSKIMWDGRSPRPFLIFIIRLIAIGKVFGIGTHWRKIRGIVCSGYLNFVTNPKNQTYNCIRNFL